MLHRVLLIFGLGATVGLTSLAPAIAQEAETAEEDSFTLSGRSLLAVERRTVEDDYRAFFRDYKDQRIYTNPANPLVEQPRWQLSEDVVVLAGDPVETLETYDPAEFMDIGVDDSFRVRVQVVEWDALLEDEF